MFYGQTAILQRLLAPYHKQLSNDILKTKIVVVTSKVNEIVKRLSSEQPQMIAGFKDEQATMLEPNQIYRVYASEGKVYAEAENGTHLLRLRLYEVEQRLAKCSFVRISNGEIINLKKVKGFDLSFVGTICVSLSNGTVTYVSRRHVSKIKQFLGL